MKKRILIYETKQGNRPFAKWFKKLKDKEAQTRIRKRILNAAEGYLGDHRNLPVV
ncbi:MAG: hypothetical protein IJ876_06365 [Elusimicrobiaceae bacterium]|nr:hypothetical protein [Elusimicrobiaceae bacterium]